MQDQPILSVAEREAVADSAILGLMLNTDNGRLWSKDEIDREMGRDTIDSLNRLYGAGLIHRLDGKRFFWPTRAASVAEEIKM